MRRTALVLLTTAVLGTVLTGCGETETILVDRVTQGQQAEDAVQGAREIDQRQSEAVESYLGEQP